MDFKLDALQTVPLSGETIHIERPMKQTQLHWGMYGPVTGTRDKRIASLASHLLGGSQSSRLYRLIRSERGLAYTVRASTVGNTSEGFLIGYVATDSQRCLEAQHIIIEEYDRLTRELVSDKRLQIAKNSMIGTYLIAQDNKEARNSSLAYEEMYGISLDPLVVSEEIKSITAADIQELAARYCGQDRMLFIRVGG
jgi:predicted Zn-dependent peptidase